MNRQSPSRSSPKPASFGYPETSIDSSRERLAFNEDDDCSVIRGVAAWFPTHPVVRMTTFGGGSDPRLGDLCCLFHSVLKSLDPKMQSETVSKDETGHEICNTADSKFEHQFKRHIVAIEFKRDLAHFLIKDRARHLTEEARDEMELQVKYLHTFFDPKHFRRFYERVINSGIDARNTTRQELEKYLLDPRLDVTYSIEERGTLQYVWSPEIRQLPITTGLFAVPTMLSPEAELRSDDFRVNIETGNFVVAGSIGLETMINNLVQVRNHGLISIALISEILGISIYLLEPQGEPHLQGVFHSYDTSRQNHDLVRIFREEDRLYDHFGLRNTEAPCVVIKFDRDHYENIGVVHEINGVPQIQTVFSPHDPFIRAIQQRREDRLRPRTPVAPVVKRSSPTKRPVIRRT